MFDENKVETRIPIADVEEIYQHAAYLRQTVARYLAKAASGEGETAVLVGTGEGAVLGAADLPA